MTINPVEGTEHHLYAAEELVPFYNWLDAFMKFAERLEQEHPLKFSVEGTWYTRRDYWFGLAYKCFTRQPTKDVLDELNKILAERDGITPVRLKGNVICFTRLVPHVSQMHTFLKKLPNAFKATMAEEIFRFFCEEALLLGLITKNIAVYIDYTNKFFYGLVHPGNKEGITGTNKGPGTKWDRKKGHSKVPDILRGLQLLR